MADGVPFGFKLGAAGNHVDPPDMRMTMSSMHSSLIKNSRYGTRAFCQLRPAFASKRKECRLDIKYHSAQREHEKIDGDK